MTDLPNLTHKMWFTLLQAEDILIAQRMTFARRRWDDIEAGWFQPTRQRNADVYAHTNTCKALVRRGMLETDTDEDSGGVWYRITLSGVEGAQLDDPEPRGEGNDG